MKMNKYQTELTDELLSSLPDEVKDQLLDIINNVEFVRRLVSPSREYAKDRPRDDRGRIIVDLANPHILEDMDYFRPTALHYQKYGCFTQLRPNSNPNSEYGKWIREEKRRCWEGYVRESDGEWVTGYMYWFLNYSPIMLSKIIKGTKRADRVKDFPEVWEGIYWRFHYKDQARNGGLYNDFLGGQNCAELASRGKGKSYSLASILSHNFVLGVNAETAKRGEVTSVVTAYQKEYLTKDGVLNKFVSMADFCAENTQFPRRRLKSSLQDMTWLMGYKDAELGIEKGSKNLVLGVSSKDDESKTRGKRAADILVEEFGSFPRLIDLYNVMLPSVQEGDISFGQIYMLGTAGDEESDFAGAQEIMYNPKGYNMYALPNVFDKNNQGKKDFVFFFPGYVNRKGCYNEDGVSDVIKALIEILMNRYRVKYNSTDPNTVIKTIAEVPITPAEAIVKTGVNMFPVTDLTERLGQLDSNPREYDDVYTGSLILKDGEVQFSPSSETPIREFPHKDNKMEGSIELFQLPVIDKETKKPYNSRYIVGCLKEGELVNTDSGFKKVEDVTLEDKLINIEGKEVEIYNLQRYYNTNKVYRVKLSSITDSTVFSQEHPIYACTPKRKYNSYSRVRRLGVPERYYEYNFDFRKVSELKIGDYVKSPILYTKEESPSSFNDSDIWYLLGVLTGDGWASSNGHTIGIAFNKSEQELIDRCKWIVENKLDRKFTFAKDKGNCVEYSFCHKELNEYFSKYFGQGAPNKHIDFNLKTVPYILRKNFILGYIDTDGSITRKSINIVSVSKTLLCDIQDWLFSLGIVSSVKVLRPMGIHTINDKDSQCKETYQLNIGTEGLNDIKNWDIYGMKISHYNIIPITNHNRREVFIKDGYIYLKVKNIVTEDYTGTIYNFECDTHTFMCNYIPTHNCDPYDDDESNTMSLGSVFVLDLWTDKIVAEYTGRPLFAEDFYEICRKLCLFYNARMNYENNKKGLFGHFSKMNSTYLLTEQLEFLKDKDMVKEGYGNKARGTNATAPVNAFARNLLRSWLLKPVPVIQTVDGEEQEVLIPNLYTLRNRALIKELIMYNSEGNFDRISAMGMLMLLREDRMILYKGEVNKEKEEKARSGYLGNDSFFERNYNAAVSRAFKQ